PSSSRGSTACGPGAKEDGCAPVYRYVASGRRYRASTGDTACMSATPAMHATPPETTEKRTEVSAATVPASTSPSLGPEVTTAMWRALSRPRIASGATIWRIVFQKTADTTSAHPSAASRTRASGNQPRGTSPKATIAPPHATTETTTARPCLRTLPTHPLAAAPSRAPAPGAAYMSPRASGATWEGGTRDSG